ncbi:MAG: hypothetical protein AB7F43_07945 [Bacteriovoracia bacterium]
MKKLFGLLFLGMLSFGAISASADPITYVPYNQWVSVPYCGGETRLICHGPRRENQCNIEFRNSYNCPLIDLYSGYDFYPTSNTVRDLPMKGSFYVDNDRISWFLSFNVYMHNSDNSTYSKLTYQFDY